MMRKQVNKGGTSLCGVGLDSHVGYNPRGTLPKERTRFVMLSQETIRRDRIERHQDTPGTAITKGPANIMERDRVILAGYGRGKGRVLGEAFYGEITPNNQASQLRLRGGKLSVFVDQEAAEEILKARETANKALASELVPTSQ